ncbi:glycosyltransferase [Paenibacillus sp. MMO-177]|uniref:glycosyltransferase n=1 Tax=Paenibacillus sp. MMO-177 TaxID=3081289 RepID=UPI003016DF98
MLGVNTLNGKLRKNQFIFAGRLDKAKGIDVLLMAWNIINIKQVNDKPHLLICGSGPEEDWCLNFIKNNYLEDSITFLGRKDNKSVLNYIAESRALILPTQWYEGFPMTIVESFSFGTPVLGSAIGNVGGIIIEGVNGYTFNQKIPEEIVKVIFRVLKDGESEERNIYKSTYEHFIRNYTEELNYNKLREIYSLINGSLEGRR